MKRGGRRAGNACPQTPTFRRMPFHTFILIKAHTCQERLKKTTNEKKDLSTEINLCLLLILKTNKARN